MIPLSLARLPENYANVDQKALEDIITKDYYTSTLSIDTINLWVHQAVIKDLLARLPQADPQQDYFPHETRLPHLKWMLQTAWETDMAPDKAARWLAFVQGVCATRGWIDVSKERDRTRHILHLCARIEQKPTPKTLGPEQDG